MNPESWKKMVEASRNLECSMGNGIKIIEANEKQTSLIQRRGVYAIRKINKGEILKKNMTICLRPKLNNSISPYQIEKFIGKKINKKIDIFQPINKKCLI